MLFVGLRPQAATNLAWKPDVIDSSGYIQNNEIHLPDPKNREYTIIPLSSYAVEAIATKDKDGWVFPRKIGTQPVDESGLRHWMNQITEQSGVKFSRMDLRRTFITIAESLDLSQYTIKRLAGHSISDSKDVTGGYIVSDLDRLRAASERIGQTINAFHNNIEDTTDDTLVLREE